MGARLMLALACAGAPDGASAGASAAEGGAAWGPLWAAPLQAASERAMAHAQLLLVQSTVFMAAWTIHAFSSRVEASSRRPCRGRQRRSSPRVEQPPI